MQKKLLVPVVLFAVAVLAFGAQARASCTLPQCSYGDYRTLGMAIDGYLTGGVSCLRDIRDVFESGACGSGKTNRFKVYAQLTPSSSGSWNKPPMSWVINALDTGDVTSITRLDDYSVNQLDSAYGLWGKEIMSWIYWSPLPTMAVAYQEIPEIRPNLRPLMQAHVGTLTLFSTGDQVLTPSIRTYTWNEPSTGQDYFLKRALGLNPPDPPNLYSNDGQWGFRISKVVSHNYMAETVRLNYLDNYQDGSTIDWVVAKLNALGVTFRAKVHIWRYQNGDFATLIEKNVNGNNPPVYAVSRIGGTVRYLGPQVSTLSPLQCYRDGDVIRTSYGTIPAPSSSTPLLYYVTVGPTGVTRVQ